MSKIKAEEQACLSCGSTSSKLLLSHLKNIEEGMSGEYTISRCGHCGYIFLSYRPVSVSECYPKDYLRQAYRYGGLTKHLFTLRYYLRWLKLRPYLKKSMRVLEIGCGNALFLSYLEKKMGDGVELLGVDYSTDGIILPTDSKIKLVQGDIQSIWLEGKYDLILMHDVLEHLQNPVYLLRYLRSYLKPDGVIVGSVPNWKSIWMNCFFTFLVWFANSTPHEFFHSQDAWQSFTQRGIQGSY